MNRLFFGLFLSIHCAVGQIAPQNVTIARDRWGVPHIFAKTDAEAAYGLAYAHAEDDFKTIQLICLPAKGKLGKHLGKQGAAVDYVVELLHAPELVAADYDTQLSPEFKQVINGYLQGLNDYAARHPEEVLVKGVFPLTPQDYFKGVVLSLAVISGVDDVLQQIFGGRVSTVDFLKAAGSNAIAVHKSKTTDGQTYLAINSHQPLEGPVAWYEAHLCSEEGWNILGGLFPAGATVFHGVNEHLGWAHTVNGQDKIDVYQLEMNPKNKSQYRFDGQWVDLESKSVKLRVKGIPFPIKKKAYWSKYGATVITKKGTFALRTGANSDLRGVEQWYRMNKARSFSEFYQALTMTAIPGFNIVYADADTIFYVSNGKIPLRDRAFNWRSTLPGNTSKTLWTAYHPLRDLPQYMNPKGGYLFNMNHTPFNATAPADNLKATQFDPTMGYETFDNNRSTRFGELMQTVDKLDYATFKRFKYDGQLPQQLKYSIDVNAFFTLKADDYPDVRELILTLQQWDRRSDANSRGAAVFLGIYTYLKNNQGPKTPLSAEDCVAVLRLAKADFEKQFGRTDIVLGEYQKLVRGTHEWPLWGLPDVITAMHSVPYRDGKLKAQAGESYIELVRFEKGKLPVIETVNCFGASNHPGSPHYADQTELFLQQKTKPMTLDKVTVLKEAKRVYHPGE
ncbi:MAG: penicillin acylase family protein [Spirosomataceae bacterium]